MTCRELERVLPELEGVRSFELEQHLRTCSACSELVSDLSAIGEQAVLLQTTGEEPSPRVWTLIESTLRQEGLIHDALPQLVMIPPRASRWRFTWLMPAMATLLVVCGLLLYQRGGLEPQPKPQTVAKANLPADQGTDMVPEEEEVLTLVAERSPAMRASFESDLRAVDAYIRDAERSARTRPNDEIAQQYLMNAYEQKAMVYELAMDRSQP
ncbi:MAG: hypothetical protein WB952_17860 [Terriglobales bacterium]